MNLALTPFWDSLSAKRRAWVVLPDRSTPSNTISAPRLADSGGTAAPDAAAFGTHHTGSAAGDRDAAPIASERAIRMAAVRNMAGGARTFAECRRRSQGASAKAATHTFALRQSRDATRGNTKLLPPATSRESGARHARCPGQNKAAS